jgi:YD repeat-containing protein
LRLIREDARRQIRNAPEDSYGRTVAVTDPLGNRTSYGYDLKNRIIRVTDAAGGAYQSAFDPYNNRTSFTDASNHATLFTYNNLNQRAGRTDALLRAESTGHGAELLSGAVLQPGAASVCE